MHRDTFHADDGFGTAVAVDATRALVGAYADDTDFVDAGAAFLFDLTTGRQTFKLLSSIPAPAQYFGMSTALSDGLAFVGATAAFNAGTRTGLVYVFDAATGEQLRILAPPSTGAFDGFGKSIAVYGGKAAVGAPYHDAPITAWDGTPGTSPDAGAIYIFDIATGTQLRYVCANDKVAGSEFGHVVSMYGDTLIVGQPKGTAVTDAGVTKLKAGAAYVFSVSTGAQQARFTAPDPQTDNFFGFSVSVNLGNALIGCPRDTGRPGRLQSGSAYLCNVASYVAAVGAGTNGAGTYTKYVPDEMAAIRDTSGYKYGTSVALQDNLKGIGALYDFSENYYGGSVMLIDETADVNLTGLPRKLIATDGATHEMFGASVALSGPNYVVGAPAHTHYDEDGVPTKRGGAYLFRARSFSPPQRDPISEMAALSWFGAMGGAVVAAGLVTILMILIIKACKARHAKAAPQVKPYRSLMESTAESSGLALTMSGAGALSIVPDGPAPAPPAQEASALEPSQAEPSPPERPAVALAL